MSDELGNELGNMVPTMESGLTITTASGASVLCLTAPIARAGFLSEGTRRRSLSLLTAIHSCGILCTAYLPSLFRDAGCSILGGLLFSGGGEYEIL